EGADRRRAAVFVAADAVWAGAFARYARQQRECVASEKSAATEGRSAGEGRASGKRRSRRAAQAGTHRAPADSDRSRNRAAGNRTRGALRRDERSQLLSRAKRRRRSDRTLRTIGPRDRKAVRGPGQVRRSRVRVTAPRASATGKRF